MKIKLVMLTMLAVLAGCGTPARPTLNPVYAPPTPPVPIYSTPAPDNTNAPIILGWKTNAPAITGYAVNTNSLAYQIGENAAAIGPIIPQPAGAVVSGLAALLLAGLGLFARVKSGQLNTANKIIDSVIAGVEAAGNAEAKTKINLAALNNGVQGALEKRVNP